MVKKSDNMYKYKALLVVKLALILVLGYVVVRTVLMPQNVGDAFVPKSAIGNESINATETASFPDSSVQDYSIIVERGIFGSRVSPLEVDKSLQGGNSASPAESAEEELDIALLGTVAGNPEISRAIIKDLESNVLHLYKTGDTVATASIESIEKDAVVLIHKGQRKMLNLGNRESKRYDTDNTQTALAKKATQAVENNPSAKPQTFVDKLRDTAMMLPEAVVEPYAINGQVEGLKITGLENIKEAKDIGLKNGDVVRAVNGHRLTSKQKAYQISMKARSQTTLNVELLRNDKIKMFSFPLR